MHRRRFVVFGTGCIGLLAGCLGNSSGESVDGEVVNNVDQLEVSGIETSIEPTAFRDETLVVTGMLENTGDEAVEVEILAEFGADDGANLGSYYSHLQFATSPSDPIPPNTRVEFKVAYEGPADEVSEYTLSIKPKYSQENESSTTSEPDETTTADTTEKEPVSASFNDGWEDGTLDAPLWRTETDSESSVSVVEESAPDGGNYSLSLTTGGSDRAQITAEENVRWDAPWTVEGLFKTIPEDLSEDIGPPNSANYDVLLVGDDVYIEFQGPTKENEILSAKFGEGFGAGTLAPDNGSDTSVRWREGDWYRYKVRHQGDGIYQLKLWPDSESEPDSYGVRTSGTAPQAGREDSLGFHAYNGTQAPRSIHHAFISYQTDAASDS